MSKKQNIIKNLIKVRCSQILWLFVIIYAIFIFQLSNAPINDQPQTIQNTEEIVNTTVNQINEGTGGKIDTNKNMPDIEHSLLYLSFGFLLFFAVYTIKKLKRKKYSAPFAFLIGFFYGISDETHQYFVSGRDASINDVLIDGLGVLIGISFAVGIFWAVKHINPCLRKNLNKLKN